MKDRSALRGVVMTLLTFFALLALLLYGVSGVGARGNREQAAALKAAVLRATVTCYAVEGRYPPDAAYLQTHYGLRYDASRYIVSISAFADNLLPDITVLTEGEV